MEVLASGKLIHRVTVLRRNTDTTNELGEVEPIYTTGRSRYAFVESLDADERDIAAEHGELITHRVTMRFFTDIGPQDRLIFRGRTFEITRLLDPMNEDRELVALCTEMK